MWKSSVGNGNLQLLIIGGIKFFYWRDLKRSEEKVEFVSNHDSLLRFCGTNIEILNKQAPCKERYVWSK